MSTSPPQDGLPMPMRLWAVLTLVFAIGMSALDTSIANTALPTIAADLHASPAASVWVVNAYQLVVVATLLPFASLGEIFGYRRINMIGLLVFTGASLLCAMSWSLPSLTAARVLQGLGASAIMSVNTALIRFIYPSNSLGQGVGFNALVVAVSTAAGPSVAAGILSVASWQYLFWVNVPLGVVALVLALRALPPTPRANRRFDFASAQGLAFVSLPFYFQGTLGHTAVQTGLLLTPWPVATAIMAPIAGPLSDRHPPAILGGIGMAMLCLGLALMAGLPSHPTTLDIVLRMLVCGAGFGFFQSPNLKAIMSSAPPNRSGGASGIVATSRLVGQSLGAALVALCFGIAAGHGPVLALGLGAGFAGVASVISFARLLPGSRGGGVPAPAR
jgi:DHA2 family multidrug resistance protein-like MFS transporter